MDVAGLWMLVAAAAVMIATGLPAWIALIGVALAFSALGVFLGAFPLPLLAVLPLRLVGLLESDILQALPLYVFLGALLNRLPLADILFRVGRRALAGSGAGAPLAGLGLGILLAPMNGSVGSSVAMLARTVQPRLDAAGLPAPRASAIVCVASTLGVVVPPSLVLILLGDAMLRAHTEAVNATGAAARIVNTQDVLRGALIPAAIVVVLCLAIAWWSNRGAAPRAGTPVPLRDCVTAAVAAGVIIALLGGVTLGYFYAVEAAATGGVLLFVFGLATRTLTRSVLAEALRDTMAITGALFALLVAATTFTLVLRAYGTDRWVAQALNDLPGGENARLLAVMSTLVLCAFVLDAFEMIFVVIPVVMPPLLMQFPDATRAAVLALLILQASFLVPPLGYAVMMARQNQPRPLALGQLARALLPYLAAQLGVLVAVALVPGLVWHE